MREILDTILYQVEDDEDAGKNRGKKAENTTVLRVIDGGRGKIQNTLVASESQNTPDDGLNASVHLIAANGELFCDSVEDIESLPRECDVSDDVLHYLKSNAYEFEKNRYILTREGEKMIFELRDSAKRGLGIISQFIGRFEKTIESVGADNSEFLKISDELKRREIRLRKVLTHTESIIVSANQGMVIGIAKNVLFKRWGVTKAELEVLVARGNQALSEYAIDKFDINKGFRFMTYAKYWVRREIMAEADNWVSQMKITKTMPQQYERIAEFREKFVQENGREPTEEEILKVIRIGKKRLRECDTDSVAHEIVSLYDKSKSIRAIIEEIPDESMDDPEENDSSMDVELVMSCLPEHFKRLLILKWGIDRGHERTYEEVGEMLDPPCSKQAVQQKEARALKILRERFVEGKKRKIKSHGAGTDKFTKRKKMVEKETVPTE